MIEVEKGKELTEQQQEVEEVDPLQGVIEVQVEGEAEFLVSSNNGIYAVYPNLDNMKREQGQYWQYLQGVKCFTFSEKGEGCITGTYKDMQRFLAGKKVLYAGGIYESLYVPFSNCWASGENGVECLGRKIEQRLTRIVGKSEKELKEEIFKENLINATVIPEVKEQVKREFRKDIPGIIIFPEGETMSLLGDIRYCLSQQKYRASLSDFSK